MTAGLRRFRQRPEKPAAAPERCELCGEGIGVDHPHVVNVETRALRCTCRGCYLLFTRPGAGKHRAVGDRYLHQPRFAAGERLWAELGIPVRMAFFFVNSVEERTVAFYPSPAGATESLLPMGRWAELVAGAPWLADLTPDTEAVLVDRTAGGFEALVVPIDACYRLVGLVRLYWKGFDGGTEAREAIDSYLAELRARATVVT